MIGRAKIFARQWIGRNRRSAPAKLLHEVASFVESAYWNEGSSLTVNGEGDLLRKLRNSDFKVAFDVGANEGDWVREALAFWPQCHIHAFEVAPPTFQLLTDQVGRSKDNGRVTLNNLGLSDSDSAGVKEMYYFPQHPDLTCDLPRHEGYEVVPFEANLCTGDHYIQTHQIDTVDFLKIDVEGAEHRVLKGLADSLAHDKIQCLQFEYGAFATQTRVLLADYYALLSQRYWIGKIYPTYVDFRDYDWLMEDFRFANYCGVSKSRPDLRKILAS